ncbi:MAG TPA: hypothetical protein VFA20_11400 [Myxococcaceae bacterium]|nr:hypothetical protein [Myxococcaceae bacterium]
MPTPSVTQKTTNPTLPAVPPPAEQAPQAKQAPAPAEKPAPAQTGYATQDAFAAPERAEAQKAQLGDAFQQTPVKQPVALEAPAPAPAPDDRMKAAMGKLLEDPKFAEAVKSETLFKDPEAMGKLEEVAQKAAPQADPNKQPNPTDPTEGMTADERAKYDGLPPDQKKRYDELHQQACATPPPEKSVQALRDLLKNGELGQYLDVENSPNITPEGKADLQSLLFSGKLEQRSNYGLTTLSYLHDLATGEGDKTGMGVNRQELLAGLLKDLARPDTMNQGEGNHDCAGTDAAYGMAKGDPAEYARVITTLAEKGEVNLTSPWARFLGKPDAILKFNGTVDDPNKRPLTQSIFARSFDQAAAARASAGLSPLQALFNQLTANFFGLNGKEFVGQLNAGDGINGGGWKPAYMPKEGDAQRAQAEQDAQKLLQGASDDKPLYALVNGHWVSVTGAGGEPPMVTYQNAKGEKETVPMADFLKALNTICYQGGDAPPSMSDASNAGRGGGGDRTLGSGPSNQ